MRSVSCSLGSATLLIYEEAFSGSGEHPVVLVIPGGGYGYVNRDEADPVASRLLEHGIIPAVLIYSTGEGVHYPAQLTEAARAVDFLFKRYAKDIYVMGFSAGGHIAASLGTLSGKEPAIRGYRCRPRAMVLCYPALLTGRGESRITMDRLSGGDSGVRQWNNLVDRVDENTPPCFIWHTWSDKAVGVENSLEFSRALLNSGVECELHLYRRGPHALVFGDGVERVCGWFSLAVSWIFEDFEK